MRDFFKFYAENAYEHRIRATAGKNPVVSQRCAVNASLGLGQRRDGSVERKKSYDIEFEDISIIMAILALLC